MWPRGDEEGYLDIQWRYHQENIGGGGSRNNVENPKPKNEKRKSELNTKDFSRFAKADEQ